jgi:uncharacterized membrane protein YdbT with pleckstrin-like domain
VPEIPICGPDDFNYEGAGHRPHNERYLAWIFAPVFVGRVAFSAMQSAFIEIVLVFLCL